VNGGTGIIVMDPIEALPTMPMTSPVLTVPVTQLPLSLGANSTTP
jgi:hypothetical protein